PHIGMANHVDPEFRNDHEGLAGRISYRRTVNSPDSCGDQIDSDNRPRSWHPTMVAGIMVGTPVSDNDVPATIPLQESLYGMASGAHIIAYRVHDQSASQNADYSDAIGKGATISQNSWGSGCEIYQDSDIGPYLLSSAQFDRVSSGVNYLGMSSGYGGRMLVVTSAGNYGDETAVTSLWRSARVSNSAKNALVVGNVNTQDKSKTSHWAHVSSGRGPTTDGRISPLISAPGIRLDQPSVPQTLPGNNQTTLIHKGIYSTYPANNYRGDFWGTSFSAPMVSGAAALATETYQGTCPTDPSPMELRALLLHTAHDLKEAESTLGSQVKSELIGGNCSYLGGTAAGSTDAQFGLNPEFQVQSGPVYEGPDYIYGYGLLQTEAARDFIRQSHFTTGTISRGYVEYDINVQPADLEDNQLRVTLAWDDPPWPINIPPSSRHGLLQNDLDLELIDPSGRRHLPWVLDPDNPSKPAQQHTGSPFCCVTREMRDQRNTVEQVQVEVNEFGTWTIRVRAGLMIRPAQEFTLVSRAISPQTDCGDLPSRLVEDPFELPDSRLMCWLLWLAIAVLVLMILILFWLIWTSYSNQPGGHPPWLYMLAALILLALVFYVLLLQMWLVLAVLIILLLSLFVVLT
ncbi:MAG: S8 family serine peptidase, partial [Gammaproteobacteria bacterium]|nr:S8 family serine peptidase [Gammaproteobacteria bacterium]